MLVLMYVTGVNMGWQESMIAEPCSSGILPKTLLKGDGHFTE